MFFLNFNAQQAWTVFSLVLAPSLNVLSSELNLEIFWFIKCFTWNFGIWCKAVFFCYPDEILTIINLLENSAYQLKYLSIFNLFCL